MTTLTPPPPRGSPMLESNSFEGTNLQELLPSSTPTQPWSGWFRNLYNVLRPGITQTVPLPAATGGGKAGQLVFTNGILTGYTAAT